MNDKFLKQMQDILGDEYPAYEKALQEKARRGFRVNTLKGSEEHFFSSFEISHEKSPFADHGYYTDAEAGVGYTPEYLSGAFYMQEPSASSAVTVLDPKPGMKVLDMCAAPGSKTTQILEKMQNEGIVVANEFVRKRASILLENVERNGAANCIVINNDTKDIARQFPETFDAILCDAPCSGEGMMRKESVAVEQWSEGLVAQCAALQKEILENAYACLKPGGVLVYSTCTLNMLENELQMKQFLEAHDDMHMEDPGVSFGRSALMDEHQISLARRIFPMDGGEGHFIARLRKDGEGGREMKLLKSSAVPKECLKFLNETLGKEYPYLYVNHERVYGGSHPFVDTGKLHLLRNQVLLGEVVKNRFEPSHHLFMSTLSDFKLSYEMNDDEVKRYLHGEQISADVQKGWCAMCYHGYKVGGAKSDSRALKNKYPKAFRFR